MNIIRAFSGYIPLWLIASAVLAVVILGFAWPRLRAGSTTGLRVLGSISIASWSAGLALVTLTPRSLAPLHEQRPVSWLPFAEFAGSTGPSAVTMLEAAANVVLFAAGVLLVKATANTGWAASVGVGASIAIGIEVLQFALGTGRVASVTDVILAAVGAAIGHGLGAVVRRVGVASAA